jgi:hypothetical protein
MATMVTTQNCQKDKNCYTMCTFPNLFTIHNTAEIQDQNTKKLCNLNFVGIFHPCDWLIWSHSPSENVSQTDKNYGGCGQMHGWVHCGNYMTQQFVNAITRTMKEATGEWTALQCWASRCSPDITAVIQNLTDVGHLVQMVMNFMAPQKVGNFLTDEQLLASQGLC